MSQICSCLTSPHVCGWRYRLSKSHTFRCTRDIPLSAANHMVKCSPFSMILILSDSSWVVLEFYVTGFWSEGLVPWWSGTRFCKSVRMTLYYKQIKWRCGEVRRRAERSTKKHLRIRYSIERSDTASQYQDLISKGSFSDMFSYIICWEFFELWAEFGLYAKTENRFWISAKNRSRFNFENLQNLKNDF